MSAESSDSVRSPGADSVRSPGADFEPPAPTDSPPRRGDAAPARRVFADIEGAWRRGDVRGILKHVGRTRVTVALDDSPGSRAFSRSQLVYRLRDLFRTTRTLDFEFVRYRLAGRGARSCFAVARRRYRRADDGRERRDRVFVSLRRERGDRGADRWVIDEIQSLR